MPLQPRLRWRPLPIPEWSLSRVLATAADAESQRGRSSSSTSFASASEVLRHYTAKKQELSLSRRVDLLSKLEAFRPSTYDERLRCLVQDVTSQRDELPLTALVEVSKAIQGLGLRDELGPLVGLVTDSASFLSSDVILSFARTLAVTLRRGEAAKDAESNVFRLLGEHVQESMFDAAPRELSEALLAIAVFCCSRRAPLPDPAIEAPWHHAVFASAATRIGSQAEEIAPDAMLKCLRAYSLHLLATSAQAGTEPTLPELPLISQGDAVQRGPVEEVPAIAAEALARHLHELPAHSVVRALHSLYCLECKNMLPEECWSAFRAAACKDLSSRKAELTVQDIGYALQALSDGANDPVGADAQLCHQLLGEVLHHVAALTPNDALRLLRAAGHLPKSARNVQALELLAAEVMRELRVFDPHRLCDALDAFARLQSKEPGHLQSLGEAFATQVPRCPPKQLAASLRSLSRLRLQDGPVFAEGASQIMRDIVGFTNRDLCICLWAVARASRKDSALLSRAESYLKGLGKLRLVPADVSMLLWSFSQSEWELDPDLLSKLTHHAATETQSYSDRALLVTCLALSRWGFARQPVLVELYRSLYGRLPKLQDSQLALAFLLFSASGLRDQALLSRLLFESKERTPRLNGQALGNVVVACSRSVGTSQLAQVEGLHDRLRDRVLCELPRMSPEPLLAVFSAAPKLLDFSEAETHSVARAVAEHVPQLGTGELTRCLLACAHAELLHKPFLLPIFHHLHKKREELSPSDVVTCIWAVHSLAYCKPKLRRSLGFVLLKHVRAWRLPAGKLRDVLPALSHLGFWERLPASLRRAVWRIASSDLRLGVSPPPPVLASPAALDAEEDEAVEKQKRWRLPFIKPGLLRRHYQQQSAAVSRAHALRSLKVDPWEAKGRRRSQEREQEDKMEDAAERQLDPSAPPITAVDSFIRMVKRL